MREQPEGEHAEDAADLTDEDVEAFVEGVRWFLKARVATGTIAPWLPRE